MTPGSGRGATVVALHASTANRVPLASLQQATLIEDRGLEGDRHSLPRNRRALLLMTQESLDEFGLQPGDVREQVTVRGLDLHGLAPGSRLKVGSALLEVAGMCAPCERIEELGAGLQAKMDGRRGRFVRVVEGGDIRVGDAIVVESPS
jgi:MOSC domain-containing protein YiiM